MPFLIFGAHNKFFKILKSSVDGTPDIFFTTSKTGPVFIEVKAPDGKVSTAQVKMIRNLNECGCKAFECYSWGDWVYIKQRINLI